MILAKQWMEPWMSFNPERNNRSSDEMSDLFPSDSESNVDFEPNNKKNFFFFFIIYGFFVF